MGVNAVTTTFDFTSGQILTAAQMDNVNCGVPVFATTATRDAAFGGTGEKVLAEGQTCYIEDTPNRLMIYDGAVWRPIDLDSWTAYTPTVSSGTGSITTASATGAYATLGKTVFVRFRITITVNGTGGQSVNMTLPFAQSGGYAANQSIGVARESSATGDLCQVGAGSSGFCNIFTYNNGYPGGTGRSISGSVTFELGT
jgi:hypothetical protein